MKALFIKLLSIVLSFTFLLTLFAVQMVRYNMSGQDMGNFGLYFTSPPFCVLEEYLLPMKTIYIVTIVFWFLTGTLLDWTVTKRIHRFFRENF